MIKTRKNPVLPYIGLPIIAAALLIIRLEHMEPFVTLISETLVIFGYIAAVIDIKAKRIPNMLILAMLAAWILIMAPKLIVDTDAAVALLMDSMFGFLLGGGMFLLVYIISRKGLGGGDVKFMAAAGLYLGPRGLLPAMLCGTILAGLAGLTLILLNKINRKDTIPLAPFLYIGMLLTMLVM